MVAAAALLPWVGLLLGAASATAAGTTSFLSAPALQPPPLALEVPDAPSSDAASSEYLFLAPIPDYASHKPFVGSPGPEIVEADGAPVWEQPLGEQIEVAGHSYREVAMDFHPAVYAGQPVLVWWQGYITPQGFGNGSWQIVNEHYQTIARISAPPGFELDFHDLQLTPRGTAYVLASRLVHLNLHCCGGPANGVIYDQVVLEVDVKTGAVMWGWDPLEHIPLRESHTTPPSDAPWDPYHLNSISFGPSGNPIVSARNTWAAYWINRVSPHDNGEVFATLGGKRSSFKLGPGARFAWQHDVSQQRGEQISVFDDEAAPTEGKQSRGLLLELNFGSHTAKVVHEYVLPQHALAGSQGSVQLLPDGNVFVGWGQLPYISEYSAAEKLLYEASLPGADESYRAFRGSWVGLPADSPSVAVRSASGGANVYASWNGATEVASWQLLAGSSPSTLTPVGQPVARQGFQTTIPTGGAGPDYAVQAIDAAGQVLATSSAVTASG